MRDLTVADIAGLNSKYLSKAQVPIPSDSQLSLPRSLGPENDVQSRPAAYPLRHLLRAIDLVFTVNDLCNGGSTDVAPLDTALQRLRQPSSGGIDPANAAKLRGFIKQSSMQEVDV